MFITKKEFLKAKSKNDMQLALIAAREAAADRRRHEFFIRLESERFREAAPDISTDDKSAYYSPVGSCMK